MRWINDVRSTRRARVVLGGLVLVAFTSGARAADPPADADQLFESARDDMKRGDFGAARSKLVESLQLEETVGTLFNLSLCEEKLGLIRNSLEHVRAALAQTGDDDRRRPIMVALIGSLEDRVSRVVLKRAQDDSADLRMTLDGRAVEASADGREVLVDPGGHELVVRGRSGPERTTVIHVAEGATVVEDVVGPREAATDLRAGPLVAAPPGVTGGEIRQRLGAVAVTGGGAAVVAGAVLGFMAIGSKISVDHHCSNAGCDDEGRRVSTQGSSYANASTALTAIGLAGVGLGGYALIGPGATSVRTTTARQRSVGYVAGSVGAAAVVASAVAGGVALSAKRELLARCGDGGPCADPQGLDAAARGRAAATVATVALGVGITGLGLASYSLLLRPRFAPATDVRLTLSGPAVACTATF